MPFPALKDRAKLTASLPTGGGMVAENVQRPIVAVGRRRNSFLAVIQREESAAWKIETRGLEAKAATSRRTPKKAPIPIVSHALYATAAKELIRSLGRGYSRSGRVRAELRAERA